jgi:small-conductance mechanosensitive channel
MGRSSRPSSITQSIANHARVGLLTSAVGLAVAARHKGVGDADPNGAVIDEGLVATPTRSYIGQALRNTNDLLVAELGSFADIGIVLIVLVFATLAIYIVPGAVDDMLKRVNAPGHIRSITKTLTQFIIGYLGVRLALGAIGLDADSIVQSLSLIAIALSIAASVILSNIIAGMLHTTDDLQPGGRISIHGYVGTIEQHGLFNLRLRDEASKRIIVIPNKDFIENTWEVVPREAVDVVVAQESSTARAISAELDSKNLEILSKRR